VNTWWGTAAAPRVRVAPPPPWRRLASPRPRRGYSRAQHSENSTRPAGHKRPSPAGPPRGIPRSSHLRPRPRVPLSRRRREPRSGRRGWGGIRWRRNHKAASPAGRGHSHKTDPLKAGRKGVFAPHSVMALASPPIFPAKRSNHRPLLGKLRPEV
jgi:hypothetical protein